MFGVKTILCGTGKFAGGEVAKRAWDTVATYVPKKIQTFEEDYREHLESKIMGSSKAYSLCCVPFIVIIAWHCLKRPPAGTIDRNIWAQTASYWTSPTTTLVSLLNLMGHF